MIADVSGLSYPLAFAAGLVSFLSPCVFPLAPAYLAFLGGRAAGAGEAADHRGAAVRGDAATAGGATVGTDRATAGGAMVGTDRATAGPAVAGAPAANAGGEDARTTAAGSDSAPSEPGPSRGTAVAVATRPAAVPPAPTPRARSGISLTANGAAFVTGFSTVFIAVFYVFSALRLGLFIHHQHAVNLVAGLVVIVLALQTLGLFRIGLLMREQRIHLLPRGTGVLPSFLLGVTFAAGWTPCIGPQLGAILTVASSGSFGGLPVMVVYCAGLAIPFLLMAALADRLQPVIRAVNRHLGVVNLAAGALLLVFGLLLVSNHFTFFNQYSAQSPFDL